MILLDTHVWWWAISEPEYLSATAREIIATTTPDQMGIASISIWEFAMMANRGRIALKISPEEWLSHSVSRTGLAVFEISPRIAVEACNLPEPFHRDPADRLIVATCRVNNFKLVTRDKSILDYPYVEGVW
jgi:PIN domain nuclease of toxin-antitoxin system